MQQNEKQHKADDTLIFIGFLETVLKQFQLRSVFSAIQQQMQVSR